MTASISGAPPQARASTAAMAAAARLVVLCVLLLGLPACSTISDITERITGDSSVQGLEEGQSPDDLPVPGDYGDIPYEVTITGADEGDLEDAMEDVGLLFRLQEEPPGTILGLRRRLDSDIDKFREVLRSQGYYRGEVSGRIEREADPVRVIVEVEPGPRYTIDAFAVHYRDQPPPQGAPLSLADVPLERGDPADADAILEVVDDLPRTLKVRGYPFAEVVDTRYTVNHDQIVLRADVGMNTGPAGRFGTLSVSGLEDVKEDYLHDLAPWEPGDQWDEDKLDAYRAALLSTGLFRSLRLSHPDQLAEDGTLPIDIEAVEAKHRTLGAGLHYSSDLGLGVTAFWEHRNYFGRDEDVRVELDLSQKNQELTSTFLKPAFLRPDQSLVAEATLQNEETEAFDRLGFDVSAGIKRSIGELWTVSGGGSLEIAQITENDEAERTILLAGLPLTALRDSTDNPLDPTEGSRLGMSFTPYAGTADGAFVAFARSEVTGSAYYSPLESDRLILAARAGFGTIVGEDLAVIPADKRFYTGGGGTVRGFGYQLIGPLDENDNPTGGRSKLELGLEARIKVTESIGVVPFVDAGQVFGTQFPDFSREIRYAGGLGLRYYTAIGPIRLDVAAPINPREDVDDAYQFYISIGQAF
ncbi:autotransporter assembly complex family protein [Caenispirillum salinarum]|uniref:autotransporter assembly complex protein TamA n=1 Tax=Caenispirillum salinarum TaxID=859058 RepID=UPI00384EB564